MSLPKRVSIELTNRCNRRCKDCPSLKTPMQKGDMDWQLLTKIIDELPNSTVIVPFFRGESLLYPQFVNAMKQLKKFNQVQIATNGDYLTKTNQKAILETCSFFSLSLHRFKTTPHYKQIAFLKTAKNLDMTTQVSILNNLIPPKEKNCFIKAWSHHVDRIRIYEVHSNNGYGDTCLNIHDNGQPCLKPFNEMVVYWTGKVALCCHDWNNPEPLGNLNVQGIEEVWHGDKYKAVRNKHGKGRRREVSSCKMCHQWMAEYLPNGILGELHEVGRLL